MLVAVRETKRLRSTFSFTVSAGIHGAVLAWVALAPLVPPARPSLYDQEIRPYENKIVWYNLSERLPDISPSQPEAQAVRARTKSRQTLVAGPRDDARRPQLIWTPAPQIEPQPPLPAPNVVALTPAARPLRDFTVPPDLVRPKPAEPALADAPQVAILELKPVPVAPLPRPQPRPFTPRPEERASAAPGLLPTAPELAMPVDRPAASPLLPPVQPARRTFIPPVEAARAAIPQPASLPAAPAIETKAAPGGLLPAGTTPRAVRPFAAPAPAPQAVAAQPASLPAAPPITARTETGTAAMLPETGVARVLRPFAAPTRPSETAAPVSLAEAPASRPAEAALAIVSPFPVREAPVPTPRSSQSAGFSAGPTPKAEGADASGVASQLTVPGLLVRDGSPDPQPALLAALEPPTSRENLAAAARSVRVVAAGAAVDPSSARVATAPDPRLAGRVVYSIAIQMPNVSSYSGSWIVWFAERDPLRDQPLPHMQAPLPLRKVDPKYFPAAVDEKVEGRVRLAGVIRRDGRVDRIELLQHLDERLDQSSLEALGKWEFEPAARNGVPIEVDAVFEIPFHIAPKAAK